MADAFAVNEMGKARLAHPVAGEADDRLGLGIGRGQVVVGHYDIALRIPDLRPQLAQQAPPGAGRSNRATWQGRPGMSPLVPGVTASRPGSPRSQLLRQRGGCVGGPG
ncbi:hypothetical protein ACU4GD_03520 [Cupriavidus basilensis]